MKKINLINAKRLKRAFYKGKITKFKRLTSIMLVAGLLASVFYFFRYAYLEYAVSRAEIVLTYPEIAQSRYPDGSRFTYYEFIDDARVEEALEIMRADGKYENFTAEDLRGKFYLYSYLDGSAVDTVSSVRSEGNDFSYVANEYKITFVQPHDYKNRNIIKKLFTPDYSDEFLKALVEVNRRKIAEQSGGINGFKSLTEVSNLDGYDYSEKLRIYKTKIYAIIEYLDYLNKKESGFVSSAYDMSIKDIEGKYDFLITNRLDGISNFIESSGISKDIELVSNKLNVNIENNTLKTNKYRDRAQINTFAMTNYDHTFTENLINVVQNKEYGLYQARPKTAFDTVVQQKHEAEEAVAEYTAKINEFNTELQRYSSIVQTPEEHSRLTQKCEELMAAFEAEYTELSQLAGEVVTEYYNAVNENYLSAKISKKGLFTEAFLVKMGISFLIGAMLAFVTVVLISSVYDSMRLKRKKRQIKSIKQGGKEKGVR